MMIYLALFDKIDSLPREEELILGQQEETKSCLSLHSEQLVKETGNRYGAFQCVRQSQKGVACWEPSSEQRTNVRLHCRRAS